jgi:hypothetical protein
MNMTEVIDRLSQEAKSKPAANALFHVWGVRERHARNGVVSMRAVRSQMQEEGFTFDQKEYEAILRLLAELGLGKLDVSHKGEVRGLKEVRTTLKSIGMAACQKSGLKSARIRNRYSKIAARRAPVAQERQEPAYAGVTAVGLVVNLGKRSISIPVPKDISGEELSALVAKFAGGVK